MITCPVCEHPQQSGVECDVCGHPFGRDEVAAAGHSDPMPEPVPGLEPTAVVAPGTPTPALAPDAPCVWCGHVQRAGRLCDRCGMQRHRGESPGNRAQDADAEAEGNVCPECGSTGQSGRCHNCGARVPEAG